MNTTTTPVLNPTHIAADAIRVYQAFLALEIAKATNKEIRDLDWTARYYWNTCTIRHGNDVSMTAQKMAEELVKEMYPARDEVEYAY